MDRLYAFRFRQVVVVPDGIGGGLRRAALQKDFAASTHAGGFQLFAAWLARKLASGTILMSDLRELVMTFAPLGERAGAVIGPDFANTGFEADASDEAPI